MKVIKIDCLFFTIMKTKMEHICHNKYYRIPDIWDLFSNYNNSCWTDVSIYIKSITQLNGNLTDIIIDYLSSWIFNYLEIGIAKICGCEDHRLEEEELEEQKHITCHYNEIAVSDNIVKIELNCTKYELWQNNKVKTIKQCILTTREEFTVENICEAIFFVYTEAKIDCYDMIIKYKVIDDVCYLNIDSWD